MSRRARCARWEQRLTLGASWTGARRVHQDPVDRCSRATASAHRGARRDGPPVAGLGLATRDLAYVVAVNPTTSGYPVDAMPTAAAYSVRGRPPRPRYNAARATNGVAGRGYGGSSGNGVQVGGVDGPMSRVVSLW
jgi:hypothetical protein